METPLSHFCTIPELIVASEILNYSSFATHPILETSKSTVAIPNIILGKQAEFLFEAYIASHPQWELIISNIQIQDGKLTIGELDYIIQNKTSEQLFHVELACKFYLFRPSKTNIFESQWIGPNLKDTLHDKVKKLQQHQFPLLHTTQAKQLLNEHQIKVGNITQASCIKAQLFIPKNITSIQFSLEYQKCIAGYYINHSQLQLSKNAMYALPPKKEWLLPYKEITTPFESAKITEEKIKECISKQQSPLVYELVYNTWTRFFVTWW